MVFPRCAYFHREFGHGAEPLAARGFRAGRAQTFGYTFMSIEQKSCAVVRHNDRAQQATH